MRGHTREMRHMDDDALWARALELMPRGTQTMSKCPDQYVDGVHPKFIERGEGCRLFDRQGRSYIDFTCALGPVILGYCHDNVDGAIREQLARGINFSLPSTLEVELAELINRVVPCAQRVRFAKNGTDVTLAAVRIARSATGREHIAKCGYHGWGDWHAITMRPRGVPSSLADIIHEFTFNDLNSLEDVLASNSCAAVILEPQALTLPAPGFLQGVKELAHRHGSVLIFDEVVTGFRWALGGAQEHFGVTPDLACLGKAMGNGMPISAVVGSSSLMSELDHAFFSMTAGGECLSIAAAIATIQTLLEKDYKHIWRLGDELSCGLRDIAVELDVSIDFAGSAPRHNLTFDSTRHKDAAGMKDLFYQEMVRRGILFGNVVYVTFAHTPDDIEHTLEAARESMSVVKEHQDDIDNVLLGKRSVSIFRKNT